MTGGVPTGGQYCVTGLVLQLLVGFDRGLRVVIDHTQHDGPTLVAATMVLEPELGGDHYISTAAERLVEQVKIRTNGKAWTANEYELIDGFWRHATFDTRGMADAQDDVVALEQAARQLLVRTGRYP